MTSGTPSSFDLRAPSRPPAVRRPSFVLRHRSSGFRSQVSEPQRRLGDSSRAASRQQREGFSSGFTLVELLVGATLSAAVLLAVLSSYTYLGRNLARLANQQILGSEARRTVTLFTQDVRKATGLTDTGNLSASRVSLLVPAANGASTTITYYYNSTSAATSVTVNGTSISMAANALTRCVYNGSTVTSLTVLNNIASSGLSILCYDTAGRPYTSYTDYVPGIRQLALQFNLQRGLAESGARTQLQQVTTGRQTLRSHGFLQ